MIYRRIAIYKSIPERKNYLKFDKSKDLRYSFYMLVENIPEAGGYVYFMKNKSGSTLYIGSTVNILKRIWEHKHHVIEKSFTDKYNVENLVYFEHYLDLSQARDREYQLKKWRREKKEKLINLNNKLQLDLAKNWFD